MADQIIPTLPSAEFTETDAQRLTALEAAFAEAGGRGVEMAEEIDALRRKRGLATADEHEDFSEGDVAALEEAVLGQSERNISNVLNGGVSEMLEYLRDNGWSNDQILAALTEG